MELQEASRPLRFTSTALHCRGADRDLCRFHVTESALEWNNGMEAATGSSHLSIPCSRCLCFLETSAEPPNAACC